MPHKMEKQFGSIWRTSEEAVAQANKLGDVVEFEFNGVLGYARPTSHPDDVAAIVMLQMTVNKLSAEINKLR